MKKIVLIILCISVLLTAAGCSFLFPETVEPEEEVIPYLENYFTNSNEPTVSNGYEAFTYKNAKSEALSMGGHDYHGGFSLCLTAGPVEPGVATFSLEGKNYKSMSFMLGSYVPNGNADKEYVIISVEVDGKQVVDALVWQHSLPERHTIDLDGAKEITFRATEGYAKACFAEVTVWEGEPQITGYVKNNPAKKQLVKDLMPYFCKTHSKVIFTENTLPEYSDLWFMMDVTGDMQTEPVKVGGIDRMEGFALLMSIPLMDEDINYMYFNTEGDYEYLTFTVGCAELDEVDNVKEGKSWVSVFADGERVYEELILNSALPTTVTVPIHGCKELKFESKYETGGRHYTTVFDAYVGKTEADLAGNNPGTNTAADMPDTAKLISNLPPYFVHSSVDDPLFNGSTQYHTFSMGGRKYNEGVVLMSNANWLFGNSHAHVVFNLDGEFDYLSFVIGHMQLHDVLKDDKLMIYLDGELTYTFDCHATKLPEEHTIALNKCKELKMELQGMDSMFRPAYGIAEMVVYRGEAHENDLFARDPVVCEDGTDMMSAFPPYEIYVPSMEKADILFDGSTKSHYFTVDGEKKYAGFVLQTSVHMSLDADDVGAAIAFNAIGCTILALAAAGTAYESSYAAVHLEDEFKSVTFTIACPEPKNQSKTTETLYIGGNWDIKKEIKLSYDMEPTTYTVDIDGCDQLMFWLKCGEWWSESYYFYDITLNK